MHTKRFVIGQAIAEYAVLLAVVAAALLAMQVYMKRGIQGRIKELADQISPEQYEDGRTSSLTNTTQRGGSHVTTQAGVTTTNTTETVRRSTHETARPEY